MTGSLEDPGELAGVGVQPLAGLVGADLAPAEVWLLRHHLACTGHSEVRLMSHVTCHNTHPGRTSPSAGTSSAFSAAPLLAASLSPSSSCSPHFSTSWTQNNCQAQVQVPNPLSQQAPNPDPKFGLSLKNPKKNIWTGADTIIIWATPPHPTNNF